VARLSARDEGTVAALAGEVRTFRLTASDFWGVFLPQLGHALRAQVAIADGVEVTPASKPRAAADCDVLRVLVCEDEARQAWLTASRSAARPFGPRERMMLGRLVPALRERLTLERQLAESLLANATLKTCLEALPRAAMVVNARGELQFANALARSLGERDLPALIARLRDGVEGRGADFALTPLVTPGPGRYFLAIEAQPPRDLAPHLSAATAAWDLTPREAETLGLLVEGLSNKAIAARLACAHRTVEVHVSRLLAKSDSDSRSQLIARFWAVETPKRSRRLNHARARHLA
jgi:DNA-binding CsgD family transcriptional regulator